VTSADWSDTQEEDEGHVSSLHAMTLNTLHVQSRALSMASMSGTQVLGSSGLVEELQQV